MKTTKNLNMVIGKGNIDENLNVMDYKNISVEKAIYLIEKHVLKRDEKWHCLLNDVKHAIINAPNKKNLLFPFPAIKTFVVIAKN